MNHYSTEAAQLAMQAEMQAMADSIIARATSRAVRPMQAAAPAAPVTRRHDDYPRYGATCMLCGDATNGASICKRHSSVVAV